MVEVTNASSGAVLSGTKKKAVGQYDLRSWQGLTEVLQIARSAGLSDDEYATFRDTVLTYAQSGGDTKLKEKIDATLATLTKGDQFHASKLLEDATSEVTTPQSTEKSKETSEPIPEIKNTHEHEPPPNFVVTGFGTRTRPIPTFSTKRSAPPSRQPAESSVEKSNPPTSGTVFVPDNLPTSADVPNVVGATHLQQIKREPISKPVKDLSKVFMPPAVDSSSQKKQDIAPVSIENKKRQETTAAQTTTNITSPEASSKTLAEHRARIAEIKHEVNTKIGNPVTLIDSGNALGRQYMNALLGAMKALNGGPVGSLDSAMQELEESYKGILEVSVKKAEVKSHTEGSKPDPEQASASEEKSSVAPSQIESSVVPARQETIEKKAVEKPEQEKPTPHSANVPNISKPSHSAQSNQKTIPSLAELMKKPVSHQGMSVPAATQKKEQAHSLSSQYNKTRINEVHQKQQVPPTVKESSIATIVSPSQSTIASPEVTSALNQLLDEWKLFRGSGIFGTGPSGAGSPLYRKLSQLSMFAVLAGRWEGATTEITRSIKDYVNAWRHEQAITYNPTETFEHYLRRVIHRILERQKQ